jgi:hypothetical protein
MRMRRTRDALWMLAACAVGLAVVGWRMESSASDVEGPSLPRTPRELRRASVDSLASAAGAIASHDPFRIDHHPSAVAYRPELEGIAPPPAAPKPAKPRLTLAGIVGGPPWAALLDSVPGHEGSVLVRKGDTLGDLKIRSIHRDTVIVQGADTVWKLVVKQPWQ